MSDDYGYSQPIAADEEETETKGSYQGSGKIHKLLPSVLQTTPFNNHVMSVLYRPSLMRMFQDIVPADVRTWWMKIISHYVRTKDDAGNDITRPIGCNKGLNEYYTKVYGRALIYQPIACACGETSFFKTCIKCGTKLAERPRYDLCAYCDEADRWWHAWRAKWAEKLAEHGYEANWKKMYDLKRKNQELYKKLTMEGTEIRYLQDAASEWSNRDRYFIVVFDMDKYTQRRPLDEGESPTPELLILPVGKSIFDALKIKHRNGKHFFDPRNNMMITILRDTSKGVAHSEYTVDDAPLSSLNTQFTPEWIAYLMNEAAIPDMSAELFITDYNSHSRIGGLQLTDEKPVTPPAGATLPPQAPPMVPPVTPPATATSAPAASPPTPVAPPAAPPTASSTPPAAPSMGRQPPAGPPAPAAPPRMPPGPPSPPSTGSPQAATPMTPPMVPPVTSPPPGPPPSMEEGGPPSPPPLSGGKTRKEW